MSSFVRSAGRRKPPTIPTFSNLGPVHFGHPGPAGVIVRALLPVAEVGLPDGFGEPHSPVRALFSGALTPCSGPVTRGSGVLFGCC